VGGEGADGDEAAAGDILGGWRADHGGATSGGLRFSSLKRSLGEVDRGEAARRWGQPLKTKQSTLKRAREFRRNLTEAETILWSKLQDDKLIGYRFVRQHPIGPYYADFAFRRRKLVIEVDGATHSTLEERTHDARRTSFMEREGWTVVRFWNHEIKANLNGVLESILQRLPPPSR